MVIVGRDERCVSSQLTLFVAQCLGLLGLTVPNPLSGNSLLALMAISVCFNDAKSCPKSH